MADLLCLAGWVSPEDRVSHVTTIRAMMNPTRHATIRLNCPPETKTAATHDA